MDDYFARDKLFWVTLGHAVFIGILAGGAALLFLQLVARGTALVWPDEITYGWMGGSWSWVAILGIAGLVVGILRVALRVPEEISGSLTMVQTASVDRSTAFQAIGISLVSLVGGASLGPFDAAVRSGAGIGDWVGEKRRLDSEGREVDVLSGISGSLGGMLTAPFLASLFITELRWTEKARYFRVLIPSLTAAIFGFAVVFAVMGDTFLSVFALPPFEIELWHFALAIGLGVVAASLSWLLGLTVWALRRWLIPLLDNRVLRATVGGLALGLAAMVLPLTLASGKSQLSDAIAEFDEIGVAVLVAVVFVKILTVAVSLTTGFIGGPVMPTLFIGGAAGLAVHALFPGIPIALAFSCMLVAVPGVSLGAPFTMLFLVGLTVGIGAVESTPAGLAVLTAYTLNAGLGWLGLPAEKTQVDIDDPSVQTELFELGETPPTGAA